MTTEELVKVLREALGRDLKSVVLFGSAAAGDFVEGVSGRDILIVANKLGAAELAALSAPLARWRKAGNPQPQLFTATELSSSADVFPIELTDMQQSREVLTGSDPISEIKIQMHHFRLQLERELKARLHLLRKNYLACGGRTAEIARLMTASVSTFLVLFRAALRLYDDSSPPPQKAAALEKLAQHVQFDPQPFGSVIELKHNKQKPHPGQIESLFAQYLESIDRVVHAVDQHLRSPHPQREKP
jgi:hypothetical protein